MKIAHKPCAPFLEEFLGGEHTYRYRLYGTAAVPWGQTCSLFPLDLMSEAVAVLIEMILTSLEFSTCNHSSKFLRSWGKSSWLPPPSWRRSACRNAQHDQHQRWKHASWGLQPRQRVRMRMLTRW